jgi:hypothetical protein
MTLLEDISTTATDTSSAVAGVGLHYMGRRAAAQAQFWEGCARLHEPTALWALQLGYWTQVVTDVQEAITEGLSLFSTTSAERITPPTADTSSAA